jgi:hypothetical protein
MGNNEIENGGEVYQGDEGFTPWDGQSKPELEQFDSHEEFVEALAGWKADQKLGERPPSGPSGQQPSQAPLESRHMTALKKGSPEDKARAIKVDEAIENARHFEIESHRAAASGNQKSAAEYQKRAEDWAKEAHDLGLPSYDYEKLNDEQLNVAIHLRALEHCEEFHQPELDIINSKSSENGFLVRFGDKNYSVALPQGKTAKDVFQAVKSHYRDTSKAHQIEYLQRIGIQMPGEVEISQEEFEKTRPKPQFSSAMDFEPGPNISGRKR